MKSKVVYKGVGAFGGSAFRAIERGDRVVIQESVQGARWKDRAVASVGEFYALAEQVDLFNPYKQDAGILWRIAGALVRGESINCWFRK